MVTEIKDSHLNIASLFEKKNIIIEPTHNPIALFMAADEERTE